jgi:hypothetical protein
MDRFTVTRAIGWFAVAREVRGSRPMGIVADLSNVYRGTLQGCPAAVNRLTRTVPLRAARILFPTSPTCGIIPPHRGSIGIRFHQMRRIQ